MPDEKKSKISKVWAKFTRKDKDPEARLGRTVTNLKYTILIDSRGRILTRVALKVRLHGKLFRKTRMITGPATI
jgi:hypothetical protein